MNIAQLSEQLKDVPQPKLIDYARNPNSVVPQFLALAEIQRRQRLQVPQTQPVRSTVADDVLQQANPVPQMMPQGVPSLPSGMGQESFAGGGIVAFAGDEGSYVEDDEDELADRQRRARRIGITEKLNEMIAMLPAGVRNPLANLQNKPVASARQAQADVPMEAPKKGGLHKYEDLVLSKAQSVNNDPNFLSLARHVLYKETGNLENPESAVSRAGARGIMQLMPATAKMLGVNPDIPEENALGGVTYLNQLYKKYGGDPVLTAAAYNAGPGRVDRILKSGQGLSALPRETRGYIAGLAGGGIVAFAGDQGSKVEDEEETPILYGGSPTDKKIAEFLKSLPSKVSSFLNAPSPETDIYRGRIPKTDLSAADIERLRVGKQPKAAVSTPSAVPALPSTTAPVPKQSDQADVRRIDNAIIAKQEEDKKAAQKPLEDIGPPVSLASVEAPKKTDYLELLAQDIERRAEAAKKAGDENKYLAILQAGLGMLGGTSPYAMANIGAGAQKGVETYGALRKAQADEERGILAARLGLGKAQIAREEAQETREANRLLREMGMSQRQAEQAVRQIQFARDDYQKYKDMLEKRLKDRFPIAMPNNPEYQAAVRAIENDPRLKQLEMEAYPRLYAMNESSSSVGAKPQEGQRKPLSTFNR